jgi:hypothetical protein
MLWDVRISERLSFRPQVVQDRVKKQSVDARCSSNDEMPQRATSEVWPRFLRPFFGPFRRYLGIRRLTAHLDRSTWRRCTCEIERERP